MLRPELEQVPGFIDNVRYRSLTRQGWILSLSGWRDEKAVVRWRTKVQHHQTQELGRSQIFLDYQLRVGQLTADSHPPTGHTLLEQRLDETEVGAGTTLTLVNARRVADSIKGLQGAEVAAALGLAIDAPGLVKWDVFDAVLTPGDVILLMSWRSHLDAEMFERTAQTDGGTRTRRVRIVRDYGMFDRREAPQFYPDAQGAPTIHT